MRKKYQSYRILPARTVSATHPRNFGREGAYALPHVNAEGTDNNEKGFFGHRMCAEKVPKKHFPSIWDQIPRFCS